MYVLKHVLIHVVLLHFEKGVRRSGTDVWAKNRRIECGAMCGMVLEGGLVGLV